MKITIDDIAKRANVSKMTVSRVISGKGQVSNETAEKINIIMKELNYQPNLIARSLSSSKSMTIGVIIPKEEHLLFDNYITQVLSGITDVAQENDYRIMLFPYDKKAEGYLNIAGSNLVDGVILLKTKTNDKHIEHLADTGFPFVLVNHKKYSKKINFVDSENIQGTEEAVEYLVKKGHKKIGFIAGCLDETNGKDRLTGYLNALSKLKIKYDESLILYCDFDKQKAYEEVTKFINMHKRPTAIVCSDDYMALGVLEKLRELKIRIPEDISLIGFDDIELSRYIEPSLTTVRQPIYEIGRASAQILLGIINKSQKCPVHKMLKTKLIIRESA